MRDMAERDENNLQHAEQLLREGGKQEARTVLVEYVRGHPASTRGWWMLSFALTDPKQQVECVERVLRLDPNYAPAHARLVKLKNDIASHAVSTSREQFSAKQAVSHSSPVVASTSLKVDSSPQPIRVRKRNPAKKKMNWILPVAVLSVFFCATTAIVIGFVAVLKGQRQSSVLPASQPPLSTLTMSPTWTPEIIDDTPTAELSIVPAESAILPTETAVPVAGTFIPPSRYGLAAGTRAPDFTLKNVVTGKQESLSDYLGYPVIIFVFDANECSFCDDEAPDLQKIYANYKSDGLVVLGIALGGFRLGESGSRQQVRAYGETHELTFPLLNDWEGSIFKPYKIDGFPINYFVDKNGAIVSCGHGSMGYSIINLQVRIMLELIPTPVP
jgi:peroxiredoxin